MSDVEQFDTMLAAIVAESTAALSMLDLTLVDLASRLSQAVDRVEKDRTAVRRHSDAFAIGLDPASFGAEWLEPDIASILDDLRRDEKRWDDRRNKARQLSAVLAGLAHESRLNADSIERNTEREPVSDVEGLSFEHGMDAARERERRRLAREIHDGPAQVLANALFIVGIAEQVVKRDPMGVPQQLAEIRALLRDGIAEIRRFMFDLRPSLLEEQGIVPTLRYYVAEFTRVFGTQVSLTIDVPIPSLAAEQELCLFRVVQEALHNINKHANVARAAIDLHVRDRWLMLDVSDDGHGFDMRAVVAGSSTGVGLQGMRERAKLIGANLAIESAVGTGTRIRLAVPISTAVTTAAPDFDDLG